MSFYYFKFSLCSDPQITKDLDDLREKCRSAVPTNERNSATDPRLRPKSSMGGQGARTSSATRTVPPPASRPKSSKGAKLDKKKVESKTLSKKKTTTNGNKFRSVPGLNVNDLDDVENGIRLVDDEELDDEGNNYNLFIFISRQRSEENSLYKILNYYSIINQNA